MSARAWVALLLLPLLVACGERKASPTVDSPPTPPAAPPSARAGLDSAGIDRYLATVDTVAGAVARITWAPGSVILDRAQTRAALREVSADGSRFVLVRGDPALRGLQPGAVLLLWGIALRRVEAATAVGDRIEVQTSAVPLNEAMPDAEIRWQAPVNYAQGRFGRAAPTSSAMQQARSEVRGASLFRPASHPAQPQAESGPEGGEDGAERFANSIAGEAAGYEFELGFDVGTDLLVFQLEAARAGEGGPAGGALGEGIEEQEERRAKVAGGVKREGEWAFEVESPFSRKVTAKGLFGAANDLYDLRLRVDGRLSGFRTEGDLSIADAVTQRWKLTIDRLNGQFWADFILRLGAKGVFSENLKVEIPYRFTVPIIIAGIPFVADFGMSFLAAPALTSHHATISGRVHVAFDGSESVEASGGDFTASHDLKATPEFLDTRATTLGVSGMVIAVQAPRVGLGIGLLGTDGVAYIDQVLAWSIVSGGAVSMVPCRRYQLDSSAGAGVSLRFLGFAVPGGSVGRKEIKKLYEGVTTEPAGVNCKVDKES